MSNFDYAAIEVDNVFLDAWQEYSFESDIFTPADSFHLTLGIGTSSSAELAKTLSTLRKTMAPGVQVKFWAGHGDKRGLQGTGVIDAPEVHNDEGGTKFTVRGRDFAAYLVGSAAPFDLYAKDDTLVSVARKAVSPWGLKVKADQTGDRDLRMARVAKDRLRKLQNRSASLGIPSRKMSEKIAASIDAGTFSFQEFVDANRIDAYNATGMPAYGGGYGGMSSLSIYQLRVKDVQAQAGETVWEFLDRHARRNGFLMRMGTDGTLILCGIDYNQDPSYHLIRRIPRQSSTALVAPKRASLIPGVQSQNNIMAGGYRADVSNQYKSVKVFGRSKGSDATRSPFKGEAVDTKDDALPYEKTLVLHDSSIKSLDAAQIRAQYELGKSRQGAFVLEYTVPGHGQNGVLYATDTIAHVTDDVVGADGPFYVVSRSFNRSDALGPTTTLRLVPPGSIALAEVA